jgi:hypothetical protein
MLAPCVNQAERRSDRRPENMDKSFRRMMETGQHEWGGGMVRGRPRGATQWISLDPLRLQDIASGSAHPTGGEPDAAILPRPAVGKSASQMKRCFFTVIGVPLDRRNITLPP